MTDSLNEKFIEDTERWLKKVVIGLNLCPFAKRPFEEGGVGIKTCDENSYFLEASNALEDINSGLIQTVLLVRTDSINFEDFYYQNLDLEASLEEAGLADQFQVVAFHPDFRFEGLAPPERANLVNRSPFPTTHILKYADIENLNLSSHAAEEISFANENLLEKLSPSELKKLFPHLD